VELVRQKYALSSCFFKNIFSPSPIKSTVVWDFLHMRDIFCWEKTSTIKQHYQIQQHSRADQLTEQISHPIKFCVVTKSFKKNVRDNNGPQSSIRSTPGLFVMRFYKI
jgi:hypothetical protein